MEITTTDVLAAMAMLSDRNERIVRARFWDNRSWEWIATQHGFTTEQAAEAYFNEVIRPILRGELEDTK